MREWINASAMIFEKPLSWNPMINRISNSALGIINQDYIGDINILPPRQFFNPMKWLAHRSVDEVIDLIEMGERATWPKIEQIRTQTKISRTLDRILADFDSLLSPVESSAARRAG
jgi:NTE family protein